MDLVKIEDTKIDFLKNIIDFTIPGTSYELIDNNETIGYGRINENDIDPIFIYIKEEKRSNGYGTKLFKMLLDKINHNEITINITDKMLYISNIISKYNSIEIGKNQKIITYKIKK